MENCEREEIELLVRLFPSIANQLRGLLSGLYLAAVALAPVDAREKDPELDQRAARLDQNYYQLLRLVNSLSAAARLDGGQAPTMQDCDLVALTRDFCEETDSLARLLEIQLHFECALPQLICAVDFEAIRQLLFQLLSNALKFTPAGGTVTLSLHRVEEMILLEISDTGCGMDDLRLKVLFDRYRHNELLDLPAHGLGLGLSLCRHIAEEHGGTILAESKLGVGSKFTVQLPNRRSKRTSLSDKPFDYAGGFNRTLLGLADALPPEAFLIRNSE